MHSFHGKTALVTGGARGVGAEIVRRLARSGTHVVVNCFHSYDAARALQAELRAEGHRVDVVRGSVARPEQVERIFGEVRELTGGLDYLVNNAASGAFGGVSEIDDEAIDRALTTNLKGAWSCARHARELMLGRRGTAIVNVSSVGSGLTPGSYAAVGTSKAALESLTRYLAAELAADGIRVNTASASLLDGDVARLFPLAEEMSEAVRRATPFGRLGQEGELADVALFLLSEQSRWVTGQTIVADGGLSLGGSMLTPRSEWESRQRRAIQATAPEQATQPEAERVTERTPQPPSQPANEAEIEPQNDPEAAPVRRLSLVPALDQRAGDPAPAPAGQPVETDEPEDAIVIVGAGIVVPGATTLEQYWDVLRDGPELFVDSHPERWRAEAFAGATRREEDKSYQSRSAYVVEPIPDPTGGDAGDSPTTEYTARWLRRAASDALHGVALSASDRLGCVFGYTPDGNHHLEEVLVVEGLLHDLASVLEEDGVPQADADRILAEARADLERRYPRTRVERPALWPETVGRRAMADLVPTRPEVIMVDTACSSSLYALDIGVKALREGRHDAVVCGGVFAVGPRNSVLFAKLNGLSESGHVRPLDGRSDGVLFSDGAAVVVLKRLRDARRDGDRVLGHVLAVGSSSDGKGKAIYAPSVAGQTRAVQRARAKAPDAAAAVSWVVAHATGTPAGDMCELTALGQEIDPGTDVAVTSNKAVIGHTGWAAGVASVIQVLLSFQKDEILPQHRFEQKPAALQESGRHLQVPTQPVAWPGSDAPRVAAVSGFGFGGTNSHVLLSDRPLQTGAPTAGTALVEPIETTPETTPSAASAGSTAAPGPTAEPGSIAIVAWAAQLPGLADPEQVRAWLRGGRSPESSYGPVYTEAPKGLRIPPPTQRVLDRCQLMVLACADQLRRDLGEAWEVSREDMGVILGHMGPTRSAVSYAKRCYADDVLSAALPASPVSDLAGRIRERVRAEVPPSTEDSFPGMMPNVIAARISNYFDLHGPNMVVDTGFGSTLSALEVARRYLLDGDVHLALVGGLNGNTTPEIREVLRRSCGADVQVAEGAVLFAVTTPQRAHEMNLPVLATVGPLTTADPDASTSVPATSYLGADGAVRLLRTVVGIEQDPGLRTTVAIGEPIDPDTTAGARAVEVLGPRAGAERQTRAPGAPTIAPPALPVAARELRRHVADWQPVPAQPVATQPGATQPGEPAVPVLTRETVVVTATPAALGDLGGRADDPLVLSTVPIAAGVRRRHVADLTPEAVRLALDGAGSARHLRIVTDLESLLPGRDALTADWSAVAALHDLAFLTLQALHDSLAGAGGSVLGLFLRGDTGTGLHPFAGLFSGLLKTVALELPECLTTSVFTSEGSLTTGLAQVEAETRSRRDLAAVCYRSGVRHVLAIREEPTVPAEGAQLGPDDVVLAVGGGHGITAALLQRVVAQAQPTVYVVGSTPLEELAPLVAAVGGPEALTDRAAFLRSRRAAEPGRTVGSLTAEFDRLSRAAQVMANLSALEELCGPGRVHYRSADVLDRPRLGQVVQEVLTRHGRVDLVVHAAGINRSGALATKDLDSFRQVRAIKVGGYCNLRAAFAGRAPRMWCSFGSFIGLTGQIGEADYASANDFLTTAAAAMRRDGREEFSIGWTLWDEIGMGAHPVTRAFLAKSGVFTAMSTEEGVAHFADELRAGNRAAGTFHLGAAERAAIEAKLPEFFARSRNGSAPAAGAAGSVGDAQADGFYLDRIVERSADRLVAERLFDERTDGYLADHAVAGSPTLPGLFVPEIAAEAAAALVPGLHVVGFRDLSFERFLKLVPSLTRRPRRIEAVVTARGRGGATVRVTITGDVTTPTGVVLQPGVRHFTVTVVLAEEYAEPAPWTDLPGAAEVPVPDPYHLPDAPVLLTGPFVTTRQTRMHPLAKRAQYVSPVAPGDPVFGRFRVPSLLLDGLARVAALDLVAGRYVPVAAPRSIGRIDLYEAGSDVDLGVRYPHLELAVTPPGLRLDEDAPNRFLAARPDGRLVAQMQDVRGIVLGYVDATTGAPVDRAVVDAHPDRNRSALPVMAL